MLLAIDIGNTLIKFGIFDGDTLLSRISIPTKRDYTNEEILEAVGDALDLPVERAIVSSVVPELDDTIGVLVAEKCGVDARMVSNRDDFGLKIDYTPIEAAGADRLVNSFAAAEKHGVPVIVCSFGTATTLDIVNEKRELVGGLIAPGMRATAKALEMLASRLPEVSVEKPPSVVAQTTVDSIRSGLFYGHVSMIEGLIKRVKEELRSRKQAENLTLTVVATGGFAASITEETDVIDIIDENLTLEGLNLLASRIYTDAQ